MCTHMGKRPWETKCDLDLQGQSPALNNYLAAVGCREMTLTVHPHNQSWGTSYFKVKSQSHCGNALK